MKSIVFDIEADSLEPTKIWCIAAVDPDSGETKTFGPTEIVNGLAFLTTAEKLIGHNIIGYDLPAIKKIHNVDLTEGRAIVDTLVLSRLFNPTREGGHSLESWGYRIGLQKIDHTEFGEYSPEMLNYCRNDAVLNAKMFNNLKTESRGFSRQSVVLEHEALKIIADQRERGFLLDVRSATLLEAELTDRLKEVEREVQKSFRPKQLKTILLPHFTKTGALSKMGQIEGSPKKSRLTQEEYEDIATKRKAIRIEEVPFNLGSRKQIGEYLIDFGWKPKRFTPTGQPIVDESTLSKIKNIPEATLIAEYLLLQKRIAQVKSWLKATHEDDRVRGFVNPNGTITGRMTHNSPNMAQVPNLSAPYGKECRSCWTVPEGYKLVGIDASGLELRMLAHYMKDEDFKNEILHGDIHSANQKLAGLESRNQAKTFIYALLYGAGDEKLGSVVGGNKRDGAKLRKRFFDNLPAFKHLKDRVGRAASKGFLKGLDGRKLYVRSEHAALNTLLQSAGAIVMKQAMVNLNQLIRLNTLDAHFVCNVHDEWQLEVKESVADSTGQLGVDAIKQAGVGLELFCPLDGEYKLGDNWSETH
jgi:DNA polymerase I-like protein with 3'-5' exonuclease and polymerase domains